MTATGLAVNMPASGYRQAAGLVVMVKRMKRAPKGTKGEQLFLEFKIYHMANPHVWLAFRRFTFEAIKAGRTRYSAYSVVQRIRWHKDIEAYKPPALKEDEGLTDFKLNNNHTPFYARLFHFRFPEYDGFFKEHEQPTWARPSTWTEEKLARMRVLAEEENIDE